MVNREVLDRRLQKLEHLLRGLESLRGGSAASFVSSPKDQAVAERWLHLAAECVLDVAHHIIADQRFREPASFKDAITVLSENGVVDDELCRELTGMAGLRNVLVHLYLDVDPTIVFDVVETKLDVFRAFARSVHEFVDAHDEE